MAIQHNQTFRLLDLPAEIRCMILQEIINRNVSLGIDRGILLWREPSILHDESSLNVLLANRQICCEMKEIMYRCFRFADGRWLKRFVIPQFCGLNCVAKRHIQHIALFYHLNMRRPFDLVDLIYRIKVEFPKMRTIRMLVLADGKCRRYLLDLIRQVIYPVRRILPDHEGRYFVFSYKRYQTKDLLKDIQEQMEGKIWNYLNVDYDFDDSSTVVRNINICVFEHWAQAHQQDGGVAIRIATG